MKTGWNRDGWLLVFMNQGKENKSSILLLEKIYTGRKSENASSDIG